MVPDAREDLPQVAQYLAVDQQLDMPNREFVRHVLLAQHRRR